MRKLLYAAACAALLALALQLGHSTATAQTPGQFVDITSAHNGANTTNNYAITSDGQVYASTGGPWVYLNNAPGSGPFVSITAAHNGANTTNILAMTSDGRVYHSVGGAWEFYSNITGAPVPTTQQSWSQVKSRYR